MKSSQELTPEESVRNIPTQDNIAILSGNEGQSSLNSTLGFLPIYGAATKLAA